MFGFVHNVPSWILSQDPKKSKKLEKEEKEFRKKFKVNVIYLWFQSKIKKPGV